MSTVGRFDDQLVSSHATFRIPYGALGVFAAIVDVSAFIGASVSARLIYLLAQLKDADSLLPGIVAALFFLPIGKSWGLYRFQTVLASERAMGRVAAASLLSVLAFLTLLFLFKTGAEHSRGATLLFASLATVLMLTGRFAFSFAARYLIAACLVRGRRVVLIGDIGELERLTASEILHFGFEEVARFGLSLGGAFEQVSARDRLRVDQAIGTARSLRAAEFALVVPWSRDRALSEIIGSLRSSPLPVRLYPDHRTRDILLQKRESHFDPYLSVEVQREPLNRWERGVKRAFDLAVALIGLLCFSPLLILTSALIKLDSPGPVFFRQTRRGFDGREFRIWKFRTMNVLEDGREIKQACRGDARVTKIGAILRRTSVDELPQLLNVLRGEMSIVGPRPHAVAHDDLYESRINEYALRRHVKPGLTGAAQVNGLRGETRKLGAMEARIQRDLWYINHWSLGLDMRIVAQTFFALLRHEAY